MELRHGAAARHVQRLDLHPGLEEGVEALLAATASDHVAQLRREVGALAEQGVAADAVVLFPDQLATHHRGAHRGLVGALGQSLLGVVGQGQEQQDEEHTPAEIDVPGHAFGKGLGHAASWNGWCGDSRKRRRRTRLMAIKIPERFTQLFIRARYSAAPTARAISSGQASSRRRHSAGAWASSMKRSPISQPLATAQASTAASSQESRRRRPAAHRSRPAPATPASRGSGFASAPHCRT